MSVISAKNEFAFGATTRYSPAPAISHGSPRGGSGLRTRLVSAARWLAEQPRRRAVINELGTLTDHELADIGLARGDLHRVFDRDFVSRRAA